MERTLLVVALFALCVLAGYGLLLGWRHRAARQSALAGLPAMPGDPGAELAEPLTGLYVSTTTAGNWQDRVVAQGLGRRAAGAARLFSDGVCIERDGERDIFVPAADLVEITTAPGIAGKVVGQRDGILIVRWNLAGASLDSGFRADDAAGQLDWIAAARELIGTQQGAATATADRAEDERAGGPNPTTNGAPS